MTKENPKHNSKKKIRLNENQADQTLQNVFIACNKQANFTPLKRLSLQNSYRMYRLFGLKLCSFILLAVLLVVPGILLFLGKPEVSADVSTSYTTQDDADTSAEDGDTGTSADAITTYDGVDSTKPFLNSYDISGQTLSVTISDEESGIDYTKVYLIDDKGEKIYAEAIEEDSGKLYFSAVQGDVTLHIEDRSGNVTETQLVL